MFRLGLRPQQLDIRAHNGLQEELKAVYVAGARLR